MLTQVVGLYLLTGLQAVKLSGNYFLSDIGDISCLKQLKSFVASGCDFRAQPTGVQHLHHLQFIELCSNDRLTVAPSLRGMSMLHRLEISACRLIAAPDGLDEAVSLRHLNLWRNRISTMPNMSRLTRLRVVSLHDNQLSAPIEGLDRLSSLQELQLFDNPCTQLLVELSPAQRTRIKSLSLAKVAHKLPIGLEDCINLESLEVKKKLKE